MHLNRLDTTSSIQLASMLCACGFFIVCTKKSLDVNAFVFWAKSLLRNKAVSILFVTLYSLKMFFCEYTWCSEKCDFGAWLVKMWDYKWYDFKSFEAKHVDKANNFLYFESYYFLHAMVAQLVKNDCRENLLALKNVTGVQRLILKG